MKAVRLLCIWCAVLCVCSASFCLCSCTRRISGENVIEVPTDNSSLDGGSDYSSDTKASSESNFVSSKASVSAVSRVSAYKGAASITYVSAEPAFAESLPVSLPDSSASDYSSEASKAEPIEEESFSEPEVYEEPSEIVIPVDLVAYERVQNILSGELKKSSVELDVEQLYQYPVLPTGCESVALTMALNYLGGDLSLTDVAEKYLVYGYDIITSFLGDPFEDDGAGIFPPGLILTAQNYIDENSKSLAPIDTTGAALKDLFKLVEGGYPVVVWSTSFLYDPFSIEEEDIVLEFSGVEYPWYSNEHCLVLSGYDTLSNTVTVNDPERGVVVYDIDRFEEIYDLMGRMSMVIVEK